MQRREFLKLVGASVTSALLPQLPLSEPKEDPLERLRKGLVGLWVFNEKTGKKRTGKGE